MFVGGRVGNNSRGIRSRVSNHSRGIRRRVSNHSRGIGGSVVGNSNSWVMDSMGKGMGSVDSVSSMGNHGAMTMANHMMRHCGGGGCSSHTNKGSNDKSLHFCSV